MYVSLHGENLSSLEVPFFKKNRRNLPILVIKLSSETELTSREAAVEDDIPLLIESREKTRDDSQI
jgi:hypothetical protein